MNDPVPDSKAPGTRWMWVGIIVLLAVAFVIFLFNADGDEDLETIPDEAITTTEERLDTDLELEGEDDLPAVNGAETGDGMTSDDDGLQPVTDPILDDQ